MITKAAYMMQEHMRHGYSYITNLQSPNVFMVRGRLPFPQGLSALAVLFRGACPADVYAHAYFIERQSNPAQPSMQNHLTEELQSVIKVVSGLRYMKDDYSKLDNTMLFVTDDSVTAQGRMLCLTADKPSDSKVNSNNTQEAEGSHADTSNGETLSDEGTAKRPMSSRPGNMEFFFRRMRETGMLKQMGESNIFTSRLIQVRPPAAAVAKSSSLDSEAKETSKPAPIDNFHIPGRTLFPTPEDSSSAATVNATYFRTMYELHNADALKTEASTGQKQIADSYTFPMTQGHYTVLYNPIEVNEQTFGALVQRLHKERRVVQAIVVPTRQTWQHIQLWADVFPDAEIISSGPIPIAQDVKGNESTSGASGTRGSGSEGGMQVMENGMCGLAFPDFDDVDMTSESSEQQNTPRNTPSLVAKDTRYNDPADILWYEPNLLDSRDVRFVGLRKSDAHRVRVLQTTNITNSSEEEENMACVRLTPNIELHRIAGDTVADEYVLYDRTSQSLACTDLFHGEYGDFDPLGTWMCRVWFKFMRKGNYKRVDLVPRFKWLQVRRQHGLPKLRRCVDYITRTRAVQALVFAHGSPPCVVNAANTLRVQWGMAPLTQGELPKEERATCREESKDARRHMPHPITTQG